VVKIHRKKEYEIKKPPEEAGGKMIMKRNI
jgi:hypothetical protein